MLVERCVRAVVWLLVSFTPLADAATVTVFAAASLKESLDEHARAFEAQSGHKVVVAYAGSNALARQIDSLAPADLFLSADVEWMDYLQQRQRIIADSRTNLLGNSLVLIAPATSAAALRITRDFPLPAALGRDKLAIANPDAVPAGRYAKQALESLGVWKSVEPNVARTDNVRGALALVARREAPFGIVYRTDAMAEPLVRVVDTFPSNSHPPIIYPIALIAGRDSAAAKSLYDYLRSPQALRVWQKRGFEALH
ncbi:MAG TPA: molybdate ABC transporter substrate-binding protein [Casimicrobiaceae bacterium]|nr:molybdate ABC transporter substrate-binding protein [Casimicrobiaceae bacterium]